MPFPDRSLLKKQVGYWGFFSLAFGSMIGVGWVTAMGSWLSNAGPLGAIAAFMAGGLLMLLIGLCYAEVTAMLPLAGGEVAYGYRAFGIGKSFLVGWFLAFGYLSVSAFEAISIGKVLGYMFPAIDRWPLYSIGGETVYLSHLILAAVCTGGITVVNYVGVRSAARFQTGLTIIFVLLTGIFVIVGILKGNAGNLRLTTGVAPVGAFAGFMAVFITTPFWFVGFDTIPQGAEEAESSLPPRMLGWIILLSIVSAVMFYCLLILSIGMIDGWPSILESSLPTAAAFERTFNIPAMSNAILTAALIGLFTSWNGFFLAGSRVLFALGRSRIIAGGFGTVHPRYGTPTTAILFFGLLTCVAAFLGRGAMVAFVNVGAFCIVLAFFGVTAALIQLRKSAPDLVRPFRLPGGAIIGWMAMAGTVFILILIVNPLSSVSLKWPLEWAILGITAGLGLVVWITSKAYRNSVSKEERDFLMLDKELH